MSEAIVHTTLRGGSILNQAQNGTKWGQIGIKGTSMLWNDGRKYTSQRRGAGWCTGYMRTLSCSPTRDCYSSSASSRLQDRPEPQALRQTVLPPPAAELP